MWSHARSGFCCLIMAMWALTACGENKVSLPDDEDTFSVEPASTNESTAELGDDYVRARDIFFGDLRTERLLQRRRSPDVDVSDNLYWGMLIKNIAAVSLGEPLFLAPDDPTNGIEAQRLECAAAHGDVEACTVLLWPLLARLYILADQNGAFAEAPAMRTAILKYFVVMLETSQGRPAASFRELYANPVSSENHVTAMESTYLLASHVLAGIPGYADRTLVDGHTPSELRDLWLRHWRLWFMERVKRGLLVEVAANTYSKYTLASLLNVFDFAPSEARRRDARNFLDLVFAMAAVESLSNGARGGSQSRKTPSDEISRTPFSLYYGLYLTEWTSENVAKGVMSIANLSSSYFPAAAVWSLWNKAPSSRRAYEVAARVPGVLAPVPIDIDPARWDALDPRGSVFRSTYIAPSFALGSNLLDFSQNEYLHGGSEGRTISLYVNEGSLDVPRSVPQILFAPGGHRCYDRPVAVQKRNVLVFQNNIQFWRNSELRRPCYGTPAPRAPATTPSSVEHIVSTRQNGAVVLDFVQSDYQVSPESGLDKTRETLDATISRSFEVMPSDPRDGLFLRSPERGVFVWMKPLAAQPTSEAGFELLEVGYDTDKENWSTTSATRGLRLTNDKFAPVVVVVTPTYNYGAPEDPRAFASFASDMRGLNEIEYDGGVVSFRQALRASLEADDVFIDSHAVNASLSGSWEVNEDDKAYDGRFVRSVAEDARMISSFSIKRSGRYRVLVRTAAVRGTAKLAAMLDGGTAFRWSAPTASPELRWFELYADGPVSLARGTHSLYLRSDGEGIALDAVVILSEGSAEPERIRFVENIDGSQGLSSIGGASISESPDHLSHTFKSPYVESLRDSGTWMVTHGGKFLRVDYSGLGPSRSEGLVP